MNEKTVFISYRRDDVGTYFARSVKLALEHKGYHVFLDVDDIGGGNWKKQILSEVPKREHFLLLVTPGALDRCVEEDDWVRREFQLAKDLDKNIVPVFEGKVDQAKLKFECPKVMQGIFNYQGLTLMQSDFEGGIYRLISRFITPHELPKLENQPIPANSVDNKKSTNLQIGLVIAFLVAILLGLGFIVKSLIDFDPTIEPSVSENISPKPSDTNTLSLVDADKIENNTHILSVSVQNKAPLYHFKNISKERVNFKLIGFPKSIFYTNLLDDNKWAINPDELINLRLMLWMGKAPQTNDYAFDIGVEQRENDNIHIKIHVDEDLIAYYQQLTNNIVESSKQYNSQEQVYQSALTKIIKEFPGFKEGEYQAVTGQFLVKAGQTDAAVLAFAEAAKTAPKTLESLVFADSPMVITALGKHYETMQDYAKAKNWYTTAANLGYAEAEYSLGRLYDTGTGVKQDKAAALAWYRKAAEQGHPAALQAINLKDETKPLNPIKPGASSKDCAICPEMVDIPAGSFMMGSDQTDKFADSDEKPRHKVNVAAFKLGKYEVTQGQWKAVMDSNPSHFKQCGDNCPVENVSLNEVQTFIEKFNKITDNHYRLPTETEWEYACRAGQNTQYCGSDDVGEVAWFDSNSDRKTHPVGGKQPNAFGLYDMSGNVWEWVKDCYQGSYDDTPVDGSVWVDGEDCANGRGVIRGGSWFDFPALLRSATRFRSHRVSRLNYLGFRLAQD